MEALVLNMNMRWILMMDGLFNTPPTFAALLKVFAYDTVKLVRILDRRLGCAQSLGDSFGSFLKNLPGDEKNRNASFLKERTHVLNLNTFLVKHWFLK